MKLNTDLFSRNRLRLGSGLILFVFATGHLLNHALGLISLEAMQAGTAIFITPWRTVPGMVLLYGSAVLHMAIAIWAFWQRRTFRLKRWEATQLFFGMLIPPLLAAHAAANAVIPSVSEYRGTYLELLALFAVYAPVRGIFIALAVIIVWTHGCVGIHTWLRLKPWYEKYRQLAFSIALILPALSLSGYLAASMRVREISQQPDGLQIDYSKVEPWMVDFVYRTETVVIGFMLLLFVLRVIKSIVSARSQKLKLSYSPGDVTTSLLPNATLLESIRASGIPHASICGGRGRCTTCRVRVIDGLDKLPPPNSTEEAALARLGNPTAVRLACQIRPENDVSVIALVPDDATPRAVVSKPGYEQGKEIKITTMFVDLRDSTTLCEERFPFDVVFILNQFFSELSEALGETDGHYATFTGDGLMAIYGLTQGPEKGAQQAIEGAKVMLKRLERLNARLAQELPGGLKIGIGIHAGEAIVGSMGPPASPNVSALGDNINIAARLESQTKELGVPLVVSEDTAKLSGLDFSRFKKHKVTVKGRTGPLDVYAVDEPQALNRTNA